MVVDNVSWGDEFLRDGVFGDVVLYGVGEWFGLNFLVFFGKDY